jgi:hypothetical protein
MKFIKVDEFLEKIGSAKYHHVSEALIYLVKSITVSKSHKSTSPRDIIRCIKQ